MASAPLSVQFGLRVRELREAAGFSQEVFANKNGFARSYMSKIERGKANVALEAVQRLANGLGVEPKALFESPALSTSVTPKSRKTARQVPFASDGTCFNPSLRQPKAGTFVVGDKDSRETFTDFGAALAHLKSMPVAKWWRPGPGGQQGLVNAVRWAPLPDEFS